MSFDVYFWWRIIGRDLYTYTSILVTITINILPLKLAGDFYDFKFLLHSFDIIYYKKHAPVSTILMKIIKPKKSPKNDGHLT